MDTIDRAIIRELQRNGRLTNQELSERVHLSPSPCLRRLRRLEEIGAIKGYTALIDQAVYGLPITVFVRVKLDRHSKDAVKTFEDQVKQVEEILECFLMAGDCDYLLRVIVESLPAYEQFVRKRLHGIAAIAAIDTSFAYGIVKQTALFPARV
jgi:DNA-binding Lrp family transcriptional regulator